ncbi:hypothetical protein CDV31_012890 [Fusarium ambrosium]|uniref:Uncharacterized protein n=1 Tax=Fusarium ambrosium TaxID=131363 RepID=A0A428T6Q8_9HYPO|nr:hypothetical protein CDV31_012890 [Fusarium ambrosium]
MMKTHVLALSWLGGINTVIANPQSGDAKSTHENHMFQCFTYLSTYLVPIRSPIQPSIATVQKAKGGGTLTTFLTSMIHADELDDSLTSGGQLGPDVALETDDSFYTSTSAFPTSSSTNKPSPVNKNGPDVAFGTPGPFFTNTFDGGDTSSTSNSHDGSDVASGTYGPFFTDTPAPPAMTASDSTEGNLEEPDVASGTYGPFYTDTPTFTRLAATDDSTSTSEERVEIASGTYSPFYRDTPTFTRLAATDESASTSEERIEVASGTYSPFYRDTPTGRATISTGDGTSVMITLTEGGSLDTTDAPFSSTTS